MSDEVNEAKPQRNSAIELLRILSMVMIIFHHFTVHGGFYYESSSMAATRFWYNFACMGGKVGVDIFVLISGYFLVTSQGPVFNFKRILKFWGQVFFYSAVIFAVFASLGRAELKALNIVKVFFPITFSSWWFASTYFVLYLIHPFLNKLLTALDKKLYQCLLVLLLICWCIIPTVFDKGYEGNNLLWFITLYAIAGYAKLYGFNPKFTSKHYFLFFALFTALTYLSTVVFTLLGTKWPQFSNYVFYFAAQEKVPTVLVSVSLFMAFATLKMKYSKFINTVASATFGVYLIHDSDFVRGVIWSAIFHNADYQNTPVMIPYSIAVVLAVFIVCTLADLLRQQTVERLYMLVVNRCADGLLKPFKKINEFFSRILFGNEQ